MSNAILCKLLSAGHRSEKLYHVAILKYGSMVAECSVYKDIRSGKIAFLKTTFFQLMEQVLDGSSFDLQFFDT